MIRLDFSPIKDYFGQRLPKRDRSIMNLKWKGEVPWLQQIWIFSVPAHLQKEFVFQTAGILPPNGIFFGFNTIKKVGEQAKKLGGKQALLVTDEIMVQLGYADLVKGLLEKEGIKVDIFGKVDPEPHMETADLLFDMVKKAKSDLVIGLGGGSAMDMAKMTSILATNQQTPMELMTKKVVANPALKKILIPTTSGTGSEVSMFFVTSKGHDKYFMGSGYAYPEIAIIDPGLTVSMPPRVTASTGIDALSHALIVHLSTQYFDFWIVRRLADSGSLRILSKAKCPNHAL